MRYADPGVCLSCRGTVTGQSRCPHCGLDLTLREVETAWHALESADAWLEQARSRREQERETERRVAAEREARARQAEQLARQQADRAARAAAGPPAGPAAGSPAAPAPLPTAPPGPRTPPRRRLSAGAIILALGALCLVVAAIIFVSVAWGSLGAGGRALVLVGVTAVFAAVATVTVRRRLRGSAEALWAVTLGLATTDWAAALASGLWGLDAVPGHAALVVHAVGMMIACLGIVRLARARGLPVLVVPSALAGLMVWSGSYGVLWATAVTFDRSPLFWPVLVATLVALGATALVWTRGLRVGGWLGAAGTGVLIVSCAVTAYVDAIGHPASSDLIRGHGVPLLVLAAAAVGVGVFGARANGPGAVVAVASGLATVFVLSLPLIGATEASWRYGPATVLAVVIGLGGWCAVPRGPWARGPRVVLGAAFVALLLLMVGTLVTVVAVLVTGLRSPAAEWTDVAAPSVGHYWPAWLVVLAASGAASGLVAATRWPSLGGLLRRVIPVIAWWAGLSAFAAVCALRPSVAVLTAALGLSASVPALILARRAGWRWAGPVVLVIVPALVWGFSPGVLVLAVVTVLVSVVLTTLGRTLPWRSSTAAVAAGWTLLLVAPLSDVLDLSNRFAAVLLLVLALGFLVAASRPALDTIAPAMLAGASAGAVAAVIVAGTVSLTWGSCLLAVVVAVWGWFSTGVGEVRTLTRAIGVAGLACLVGAWCGSLGPVGATLDRAVGGPVDDWWTVLNSDLRIDWWSAWLVAVAGAAVASFVVSSSRWPGAAAVALQARHALWWWGSLVVVTLVCATPPRLVTWVVAVGVAASLPALAHGRRTGWRWSAPVALVVVPVVGWAYAPATLVAGAVVCVALAGLATLWPDRVWRSVCVGGACGWLLVLVAPLREVLDLSLPLVAVVLLVLAVLYVAAAAVPRWSSVEPALVIAGAVAATASVVVALADGSVTFTGALLAILVGTTSWLVRRAGAWAAVGRAAVVVAAAATLVLAVDPAMHCLTSLEASTFGPVRGWTSTLAAHAADGPAAWWWLVLGAAFVAWLLAARGWPEILRWREHLIPVTLWSAAAAIVLAVCAVPATPALLAPAAAVAAVVPAGWSASRDPWRWVGLAVVAALPLTHAAYAPAQLVLVAVVLIAAVLLWWRGTGLAPSLWWRRGIVLVAGGWVLGAVPATTHLLTLTVGTAALLWAALGAAFIAITAVRRLRPVEPSLQTLAVAGAAVAVPLAAADSMGRTALVLTVLGVAAAFVAVLVPERRFLAPVGAVFLAVAYVLRLLASDVGVVEAYTVPFAGLLLAAGWWQMRRAGAASALLVPGLALGLAPSLTLALTDPVSVRALVVAACGLALLAGGLVLRWRWPFLVGAVVFGAVVLWNVGPHAWALPRWLVVGVLGVGLLALGVTWEQRVRDGRAAVRFVWGMR